MTSECDDAQGEGYGEGDPEPDRCLPKCEGKVVEAVVSVVLVESRLVWGCNNNEVDECREPGRMAPLGPLRRSVISAEPCPRAGYLEEGSPLQVWAARSRGRALESSPRSAGLTGL